MPVKSAQECLTSAADCERMAADALTGDYRNTFLALAAKWKSLAEEQRAIEGRILPGAGLVPNSGTASE